MLPKVTIIILNWNGMEDTIECLESLKNITYPNYETLVVDNGSTDGSVECIRERYPDIEILENKDNLGFAEGNNVALRLLGDRGTKYCLLLNNDTVVDPYFLSELVDIIENDKKIGIVGPTVYYYDDVERIQSAGGKVCWNKGTAPHHTNNNEIKDVDYIMGCALLAKCELIGNIGYLNANYFAYWEEVDWCVRARKAGYRIVHVPASKIWHKGGASTKKTNGFYEYHMTRNMFWFMKQHAIPKQYILFQIYFFGFYFWYYSAVLIFYMKNIQAYFYFLKGIKDGIKSTSYNIF